LDRLHRSAEAEHMPATANRDVILLNYSASGHVTVEPKDEDRFVISAQKAVDACQQHQRTEQAIKLFKQKFLAPLRQWCDRHASKVLACYVPPPLAGHLEVFVIGRTQKYDFDLGREAAKLELALFDAGWRVSVMLIPDCPPDSLRAHFNSDGAIEVYAQSEPPSGEGDR
jgi:hypothetical protein